jgi:hypothetical protein
MGFLCPFCRLFERTAGPLLLEHQPPEGGPGLTEAELVELAHEVGISHADFAMCDFGGRYLEWIDYVTETSTSDRSTWASELDRSTDEQEGDLGVIEVLDATYGDGEEA